MDTVIKDGQAMVESICPECGGEGFVEVAVPGGYFSMAQEQWYPDEEMRECENCHGIGAVYTPEDEPADDEEDE
jgi:RecJ-like exonuclease